MTYAVFLSFFILFNFNWKMDNLKFGKLFIAEIEGLKKYIIIRECLSGSSILKISNY